jgi:phage-related protein
MVKEYYVTTPVINLEIFNNGDLICYPKITFKTYSSGTYTIINQTDGGTAFTFTTLADDETIQVWNKEKRIVTDLADTYRYSNFNQNWLRLLMGKNVLSLNSAGYIKIEYEEMYL